MKRVHECGPWFFPGPVALIKHVLSIKQEESFECFWARANRIFSRPMFSHSVVIAMPLYEHFASKGLVLWTWDQGELNDGKQTLLPSSPRRSYHAGNSGCSRGAPFFAKNPSQFDYMRRASGHSCRGNLSCFPCYHINFDKTTGGKFQRKNETCRKWLHNTHFDLLSLMFLLNPLPSIENVLFFSFQLKLLRSPYFSIKISTFSSFFNYFLVSLPRD